MKIPHFTAFCTFLMQIFEEMFLFVFRYIYPLTDDIEYNYPATVRFPYDTSVQSTERYIIAYILVLFAFIYISYFVIVNDIVIQAHLIPLVCQYEVLCDCFENIITDCSEEFSGTIFNYIHLHRC